MNLTCESSTFNTALDDLFESTSRVYTSIVWKDSFNSFMLNTFSGNFDVNSIVYAPEFKLQSLSIVIPKLLPTSK